MEKFGNICFVFILLLLVGVITETICQTRGKRNTPKHIGVQLKQTQTEQEFTRWVHFIGSLNHSHFSTTKKKVLPSSTLIVDQDPTIGDFTTIQKAIDSLPFENLVRVHIIVHAGVYKEKVDIPKKKAFITIEGAGVEKTIVQWGDMAQTIGANGQPMSTFGSATFAVNSQYFIAKNITFQNTTPVPEPGAIGKQAVALRISADTAAFVGCRFLGAQDTLYDHKGRHFYAECYIEGSVDFIFGNGLSLFKRCHMHGIVRGAITAQKRSSLLENTGFSFLYCTVTGSGAFYLGRAWGAFSRVVFSYSYMDNIIIPDGWHNWGNPHRETTVYYGQYQCTGPGASFARRVSWSRNLTDKEAQPFMSLGFLEGFEWIKL